MNSLWSHGFLDLDAEPMVVSVPDTKGRYTVIQGLNMWTDVFTSVGTRTDGGKAGQARLRGPSGMGWRRQTSRRRSDPRHAMPGS